MYKDPIIEKYLDLIKDNTTGIKGFYSGLVAKIPASMLPAVMISIESTEANEFTDVEDEHRMNLVLTYIGDIRPTLEDSALVTTLNRVLDALVGREASGSATPYALKTASILHILRHNLNVDTDNNLRTDVGSVTVITPGEIATGRFPGLFTAEGTVRFQAHYSQIR
jgi:hypothetical protein